MNADVLIVGGGIVGASTAYHAAAAGLGRVVLLERADRLATGATGACAGGFRQQFSSEVNIRLSQASVPMIVRFEAEHGIPVSVWQDGYLFLIRREEERAPYERAAALQRSLGVDAHTLAPSEAADLVPGLAVDDVTCAHYCPQDGIADPAALTEGYATLARRAGAEIITGTEVTGLRREGDRIIGVETSREAWSAGCVVLATGPWSARLAATAGVDLPVEPVPRNVVVTSSFPGAPARRTLVIDAATSFYFHREGDGVLMGMGAPGERPSFDVTPDRPFIEGPLLETAVRVFPPLEHAGIASTWAGLYEMTPDRHPIIGTPEGLSGLVIATGFSGHGFQHAPVVGLLVAEILGAGRATSVDVSSLGPGRFADGGVGREVHVV